MKVIQPSGKHGAGKLIIVDDQDYDLVQGHTWYVSLARNGLFYAIRPIKNTARAWRIAYMHREIMGLQPGDSWQVDHVHHYETVLVNQRHNLRLCTRSQNAANSRPCTDGTSAYRGVSWYPRFQRWRALVYRDKRQIFLGNFVSELDAARAYDAAAREYFGYFARTNFPVEPPADGGGA